jgi:thiamine biosynthesis lipoprotein
LDANETTVRFTVEGMKIDLGGIAKGYAINKSVEAMKKCGMISGMVDLGGNIRCFGEPPAGTKKWLIGVQDPNTVTDEFSAGKPFLVLELGDVAVATSGHYRRFVTVQSKRHSHIIDPHTGSDSDKLASVTIITPDAMTADALSTAVSVMGAQKGLALIEALPDTEAILVTGLPGQRIVKTNGAQKYIRQREVGLEP